MIILCLTVRHLLSSSDRTKKGVIQNNFLISQPKHVLYVLRRTTIFMSTQNRSGWIWERWYNRNRLCSASLVMIISVPLTVTKDTSAVASESLLATSHISIFNILTACWVIFHDFFVIFFSKLYNFFTKILSGTLSRVKLFGSKSGLTFCWY